MSVRLIEEEVKEEKKEKKEKKETKKEEVKPPGPKVRHKPTLLAALQRTVRKPPPMPEISIKPKMDLPKIKISKAIKEPAPIVPIKDIDIKEVTEDIGPQAKIELESIEFEESGIGGEIVIGKGVATSEILKRPVYKPTLDISKAAQSGAMGGGLAKWGPGGGRGGATGTGKIDIGMKKEEPPPYVPSNPRVTKVEPVIKKKEKKVAVEISGSIAGRKILKRILPSYPSWAAERGVEAVIVLKVEVTPEGNVRENIIVYRTSGFPQWDRVVRKAVLAWKFAPLTGSQRVIQTGYITFRFILE
jgi:TonB family protein